MDRALSRALLAGAAAGLAGFATFFGIHYVWIVPIWQIFAFGSASGAFGGAAVGAAYHVARARLPRGPAGYAALGGLLLLTMVPAQVLVLVRGGYDLVTFANVPATWVAYLLVELLVTAAAVGAALGWLLVRTPAGVAVWATAGGLYGWTVGHNIPLLGAGRTFAKVAVLVLAPTAVACVVFGAVDAALTRRAQG